MTAFEVLSNWWNGLKIWGNKKSQKLSTGADRIQSLIDQDRETVGVKKTEAARIRGGIEHLTEKLGLEKATLAEIDLGISNAEQQNATPAQLTALSGLATRQESIIVALERQIADAEAGFRMCMEIIKRKEESIEDQEALLPALAVQEQGAALKSQIHQITSGPMGSQTSRQIAREADQIRLKDHEATAMLHLSQPQPDDPAELLKRFTAGDRTLSALERSRARRHQLLTGGDSDNQTPLLEAPRQGVHLLGASTEDTVSVRRH